MRPRWWHLLLWLTAASGCAALRGHRPCPVSGGERWREFTSEHFILRTDLPPLDARVVVERLERYRAGLALAWGPHFDPPGKVTAIVFREIDALREFLPVDTGGVSVPTERGVLLVFAAGRGGSVRRTELSRVHLHELAHYLASYVLLRNPRWFSEGLATFLETMEFSSGGTVRLGLVDPRSHQALGRWRPMSLARLWQWDASVPVADSRYLYASAWAWVYFLANARPAQFGEFQRRLARAEEPRVAWREVFSGVSDAQLEHELNTFLFSGSFAVLTLRPAPLPPLRITERPLEDDALHVQRAELFARLGEGSAEARAKRVAGELAVGAQHVPGSPRVAVARIRFGLEPNALSAAQALLQRHPEDPAVLQLYAGLLPPAERVAPLRAALKASPEDPQLLDALASALAVTAKGSEPLRLAEEAVELAPWNAEYLDTYARTLLAAGRCDDAIRQQKRALDVLGDAASTAERDAYRRRIEATEATCAPERTNAGAR